MDWLLKLLGQQSEDKHGDQGMLDASSLADEISPVQDNEEARIQDMINTAKRTKAVRAMMSPEQLAKINPNEISPASIAKYRPGPEEPKGIEIQKTKMKILKNPRALSKKIFGPEE